MSNISIIFKFIMDWTTSDPLALGKIKSKFWFPVSSLHVALNIINLNYLNNGF